MGEICLVKERFVKKYRLKEIDDKISNTRMLSVILTTYLNLNKEVRNLNKARK